MVDILSKLDWLGCERKRIETAVGNQADVWTGALPSCQPLLLMCQPSAEFDAEWPAYDYLEIHGDSEKMYSNGLRQAVLSALGGADAVPSVRANMGCGIIPTMFGVEQMVFRDKMPWVKAHVGKDRLKEMRPGDLHFGREMEMAFLHMDYMSERLKGTGCRIFPLDLQGAFDTAHIVYGDDIFTDLYDDPDFVHHLLDLSCHAIEMGMDACLERIPDSSSTVAHYNNLAIPRSRGGVKISEDTSTLLSKAHIDEFVVPYLDRLLKYFKGGYVHYCGMNPHLFNAVMDQDMAYGLNLGDPGKHDMDVVLKACAARGKVYYGEIHKAGTESMEAYFHRILKMSRHADRNWILPVAYSAEGSQGEMHDQWMKAVEENRNGTDCGT